MEWSAVEWNVRETNVFFIFRTIRQFPFFDSGSLFFFLRGAFENGLKQMSCHKKDIFENWVFTQVFKCFCLRFDCGFIVICEVLTSVSPEEQGFKQISQRDDCSEEEGSQSGSGSGSDEDDVGTLFPRGLLSKGSKQDSLHRISIQEIVWDFQQTCNLVIFAFV